MKKLPYIFAIISVLVSCSKDLEDQPVVLSQMTFSALTEDDADTKVTIGNKTADGYPLLWSENDCISVLDAGNADLNSKMTLTAGSGTTTGTFQGSCQKSSVGYYAVYPYSSEHKFSSEASFPLTIHWDGAVQVAHKGTCDPSKTVSVAYAAADGGDEVSLSFKNVLSYIKFTTNYKCQTVTFTSNSTGSFAACEEFSVKIEDGMAYMRPIVTEGSYTVTLTAPNNGIIEPGTYYIAVLPQLFNTGFSLTFTSEEYPVLQKTFSYSQDTPKSVQTIKNHILNLGTIDLQNKLSEFDGEGTQASPYIVDDLVKLKKVAEKVNDAEHYPAYASAHYKQTADIDVNGETLTPIGNSTSMFSGYYDGQDFKISNAVFGSIDNDDLKAKGLFGDIYNATITNVNVYKCSFETDGTTYGYGSKADLGMIAAHAYSDKGGCNTIMDCISSGTIAYKAASGAAAHHAGGILGASNANLLISGCISRTDFKDMYNVSGTDMALGGILGYAGPVKTGYDESNSADAEVTVSKCRNEGKVGMTVTSSSSITQSLGGILGMEEDGGLFSYDVCVTVSDCVNEGHISQMGTILKNLYVGGIVGKDDSDGFDDNGPMIFNCLNRGDIYVEAQCRVYVGGISGYIYSTITGNRTSVLVCVNTGTLTLPNAETMDGSQTDYFMYGAISGTSAGDYKYCYSTTNSDMSLVYYDYTPANCGFVTSISPTELNGYAESSYIESSPASWCRDSNGALDLDI